MKNINIIKMIINDKLGFIISDKIGWVLINRLELIV